MQRSAIAVTILRPSLEVGGPNSPTTFTFRTSAYSETQTTDYAGNGGQPILFFPYGQKMSVSSTLYPNTVYQFYAGLQLYDTSTDGYVPPARYYIPEQGRWLTPDPAGKGAVHIDDPQTWNMYAYARNNPITLNDPSGLYTWSKQCGSNDSACQQQRQAFRDSLAQLTKARDSFDPKSKEYKRLNAVLTAYGQEGKGGPVIAFGHLDTFAGQFNPKTNTIKFDTEKVSGNSRNFAVLSGHEGEHYSDRALSLNPFQREYRGYEVSSWVAQGVGFSSYSTEPNTGEWPGGRGTLWQQTWGLNPDNRQMFFTIGVLQTWKDYYADRPGFRGSPVCCPMDPAGDQ